MASEGDGKKLCDLRVVDLRAELEKRGLDKTGVKAHLIERLQKALQSEGKNPDEYEFDLSDKKTPVKRLSTSTNEQNDSNVEQAGNDSSVLMIETPFLETSDINIEGAHENETLKKCENISSESPLNLSIEEEEEHMLLNSGDEHDNTTESVRKDTDEKSTTNAGASSDSAKDLASTTTKENDEEKEEDEEEDGNTDEVQVANHDENVATSGSKTEDTTSMTEAGGGSTAPAPEMSNSTAVASDKDGSKNDKDKNNKNGKSNPGRSLWVTNLLPSTRAQELKHLLSRFGKVIGAKVVQSSRYPRTRCYGYVTMETRAAADLCIEKLNNTELKGQIIRVAKVRPEHSLPLKTTQKKPESTDKSKKKTPPKQMKSSSVDDKCSSGDKRKASSDTANDKRKDDKAKKDNNNKDSERESRNASRSSSARKDRSLSKSSGRRPERKTDILTFDKIREERERQRQRERERALREEEKRRRELQRTREIEKRQREEAMRLEREREKLRVERERLDRQRVEIMRLERERQKLEREKLEQEKQELRRQQMRLEEARRPVKRPSSSSTSNYRRENASYNDDRKRLVTERHYEETPPPPRFEVSSREPAPEISNKKEISKDYKSRMAYSKRSEEYAKRTDFKREYPPAERHSSGHPSHMVHSIANSGSSSKYESSAYVNRERERDIREPGRREAIVPNVPPPRISKDARYNERGGDRSPVPYRTVRDERERRPVSDHHTKSDIRSSREHRYADNAGGTVKDGTRYRESGSQWHSNSSPVKPFSGMSGSTNSSRDSWSKADTWRPMESSSNDRWGNSSSRIILSNSSGVPNAMYAGGNSNMSGMGAGMSCPPPPGNSNYSMDRFDNYKSITSSRKY